MSLRQLLRDHNISFAEGDSHHHVRNGWVGVDCPWCGTIGKWHLGIHLETLTATCWRCGRHDFVSVLSRLLRINRSMARQLAKELPKSRRLPKRSGLSRGTLRTPPGLEQLSRVHKQYLLRRGFDPEHLIRLWGLRGLGPLAGPLSWRIWIPVHLSGEVVSWTTRSIGITEHRYVHASPQEEVWPIKTILYGWDYVWDTVIVCEGPTDVWRIGPGAVAVFGQTVSDAQLSLLATIPKRIVCFDSEPSAQEQATRLCEQLQCFPGETIRIEIEANDPGSASEQELSELKRLLR